MLFVVLLLLCSTSAAHVLLSISSTPFLFIIIQPSLRGAILVTDFDEQAITINFLSSEDYDYDSSEDYEISFVEKSSLKKQVKKAQAKAVDKALKKDPELDSKKIKKIEKSVEKKVTRKFEADEAKKAASALKNKCNNIIVKATCDTTSSCVWDSTKSTKCGVRSFDFEYLFDSEEYDDEVSLLLRHKVIH